MRFTWVLWLCIAMYMLPSPTYASNASLEFFRNIRSEIAGPATQIARQAVADYLKTGSAKPSEAKLHDAFNRKAAVFVTISRDGVRRGCAGGFEPSENNLRDEISRTAIRAATGDTRYRAIRIAELAHLTFTVSIVGPLKPTSDPLRYPPAVFGLLARSGWRTGVILPGEAKTSSWGVTEARRQGGIGSGESCELYVFEAVTLTEPTRARDSGRR